MNRLRAATQAVLVLVLAGWMMGSAVAADAVAEHWMPLQRFIGEWSGTATGQAGEGAVSRRYSYVMSGRYVQEVNTTRYPAQEKNKAGEVHEHLGMFSYDKVRKLIVLRQFHVEGFVNTFRQSLSPEGQGGLVFDSEMFENFSNAWKARESYLFISDDEFVETFELAPPGQAFQVYSRNHFKRGAQ